MGDHRTWKKVLNIVKRYDRPFIVVSATARTTRQLLASAEKAKKDLSEAIIIADDIKSRHYDITTKFLEQFSAPGTIRKCHQWIDDRIDELKTCLAKIHQRQNCSLAEKDAIASIGERLSSYLFAECGTVYGLNTQWIDAADVIRTDSTFGKASPDIDFINHEAKRLWKALPNNAIPVMGGYYGKDAEGHITTLGFEGSDYTASLLGAALSAEAIEIWTDVSGIYTCDPRIVPDARPIANLSFREATELAYFGAKVLHPSTTKPASLEHIPVYVKNIFEPEQAGTKISHGTTEDRRIKAMTFKEDCMVVTVSSSNTVMGYEFLAGVFDILRQNHLPVDVVTTTEASVSIATESGNGMEAALAALQEYGSVDLASDLGIISLVGCHVEDAQSLIREVLATISNASVTLLSYSHSKGNLNIVMNKTKVIPAVIAIHKQLFEK